MIKLSERLLAIAACIDPGETVADIGTDHGLLPIFLYEQRISPKIILCDLKPGPLDKAKKNIETFAPLFSPAVRQGDGLTVLAESETDTVVIAGMGGELIAAILGADLQKTRSFRKFILQPRTGSDKLREFLFANDITIIDERLAPERGRICEVITAVPGTKFSFDAAEKKSIIAAMERDLVFEINSLLLMKKDPYLEAFISRKISKEKEIIRNIEENGRNVGYLKAERAKKRIDTLETILRQVKKEIGKE